MKKSKLVTAEHAASASGKKVAREEYPFPVNSAEKRKHRLEFFVLPSPTARMTALQTGNLRGQSMRGHERGEILAARVDNVSAASSYAKVEPHFPRILKHSPHIGRCTMIAGVKLHVCVVGVPSAEITMCYVERKLRVLITSNCGKCVQNDRDCPVRDASRRLHGRYSYRVSTKMFANKMFNERIYMLRAAYFVQTVYRPTSLYRNLMNLLATRVAKGERERETYMYIYHAKPSTNQFHATISTLHSQLLVRVNTTDAASALARTRVHRGSLRRANLAARDAGEHTLHTEERNVHLMWSRLNLPSPTRPDSLSRLPPLGRREGSYVRFTLNGILQARLGQDIASCRMFDLPSKPPSTLEPSSPPSPHHPHFPFAVASAVVSRASLRYPHAAISTRRVLIRDIMLCCR